MTPLTLVRPALGEPSGGTAYDLALLRSWPGARDVALPGSWPFPSDADRAALAAALAAAPGPVVVDGLVGSCCPHELAAAVARGQRVVLVVHLPLDADPALPDATRRILHQHEQRALDVASAVVVPSTHAASALCSWFRVGGPVVVATPGQDAAPVARGSVPPQVLMLGALSPNKNHTVVIEALKRLERDRPRAERARRATAPESPAAGSSSALSSWSWRLVIAGPDRGTRSALAAAAAPLAGRVTFTGTVTGSALDALWDATDLLALPSLVETYGLVVSEALARGVPALVSRGTGAAEALAGPAGDAPPGALVDPDAASWAHALGRWLTDPGWRHDLRLHAGRRRRDLIPWSVTASLVEAVARSG